MAGWLLRTISDLPLLISNWIDQHLTVRSSRPAAQGACQDSVSKLQEASAGTPALPGWTCGWSVHQGTTVLRICVQGFSKSYRVSRIALALSHAKVFPLSHLASPVCLLTPYLGHQQAQAIFFTGAGEPSTPGLADGLICHLMRRDGDITRSSPWRDSLFYPLLQPSSLLSCAGENRSQVQECHQWAVAMAFLLPDSFQFLG